jgi:hypothetical protein
VWALRAAPTPAEPAGARHRRQPQQRNSKIQKNSGFKTD